MLDKFIPEPTSGCWLWIGDINAYGYGRIRIGGRDEGTALAHRLFYETFKGPIPLELEIDHLCRVRCCVNPDHLEAVPHGVNVRRGDAMQNGQHHRDKTHCPHGHPYDESNTYLKPRHRGGAAVTRVCRECRRQAQLLDNEKRRAARRLRRSQAL